MSSPLDDSEWQTELESIVNSSLSEQASPLTGVALAYRELYTKFLGAGFDTNQALYLTSGLMNGHPGIAPSGTGESPEG